MLALSDIEVVREVSEAMRAGQVMLATQPVRSVFDTELELYRECLARLSRSNGELIYPASFIPSLERLHMMRDFDAHVVAQAIEQLRQHPHLCLGVNISAQSATIDEIWAPTLAALEQAPTVARRLIVEITESAPLERGRGRQFCALLQHLGCRIAVDDFGVGFGVQTSMEITAPDIVKIAGSLVTEAGKSAGTAARLARMISLAASTAKHVIAEGVESLDDLHVVQQAGAGWVQGYYLGAAALEQPQ